MISRCPSCAAVVAEDAARCPSCHWDFAQRKRILPGGAPPAPPLEPLKALPSPALPAAPPKKEEASSLRLPLAAVNPIQEPPKPQEFGHGLSVDPPFSIPTLPAPGASQPAAKVGEIPVLPALVPQSPKPAAEPSPASKIGEIPVLAAISTQRPQPSELPPSPKFDLPKMEPASAPKIEPAKPIKPPTPKPKAKESEPAPPRTAPKKEPRKPFSLSPTPKLAAGAIAATAVIAAAIYFFTKPEPIRVADNSPSPFSKPANAKAQAPAPSAAPPPAQAPPAVSAIAAAPPPLPVPAPAPANPKPPPPPPPAAKEPERVTADFSAAPKVIAPITAPLMPAKKDDAASAVANMSWSFEGRVYDLVSLEGVYGATLVFKDGSGRVVGKTTTGEEGRFRATVPAPAEGGLTLEPQHPDFLTKYFDEISPPFRKVPKAQRMILAGAASRNKPWIGKTGGATKRNFVMIPKSSASDSAAP